MQKKYNSLASIGDIYGKMLNQVQTVEESKIKKGGNDLNDGMPVQDGGPSKKGGWHKALEDLYMGNEEDEETDNLTKTVDDARAGKKKYPKDLHGDFDVELDDEDEDEEWGPVKGIKELKDKIAKETDPKKKAKLQAQLKERERYAMGAEDEEEDEETLLENEKISKQQVNNTMKKQKSVFDQLYNKIVSENFDAFGEDAEDDIDALGLGDATPDSDLDDDFGGEDDVTFTLDRATAQALCDVLQGALGEGGEEDFGDEGDDLDFGDEGEDDDLDFEEDEETFPTDKVGNDGTEKDIVKGGGHPLQQKNNKVKGKPQPRGGKASSDVTDKVGNDGTRDGTPNHGKNNKVSNLKQGEDFFR